MNEFNIIPLLKSIEENYKFQASEIQFLIDEFESLLKHEDVKSLMIQYNL